MVGVLDDLRVIELGTFITGPYAGMLLANLGADVIKVEQPKIGDPFRNYEGSLYSPQFRSYNADKRSVTMNLKDARGRELLYKLASEADVFIENYRPGVADQLAIGWDQLKSQCPRLIYCSITGFGPDGPYMDRPCYDTVAQALSGYLSQFLKPGDPRITGPAVADAISGLFAANGILGALHERARTGRGKRVEVTMLDALIAFAAEPFGSYFATGHVPTLYTRPSVSQSYVFNCADGKLIALHLASPQKFWTGLTECIGRPELASDDRFSSRENRVANYDVLTMELRVAFEAAATRLLGGKNCHCTMSRMLLSPPWMRFPTWNRYGIEKPFSASNIRRKGRLCLCDRQYLMTVAGTTVDIPLRL